MPTIDTESYNETDAILGDGDNSSYAKKVRGLTVILEVLPAFVGLLGLGWIYADRHLIGLGILLSFGIWNIVGLILDVISAGFFLCAHVPINLGLILISATFLYRYAQSEPDIFA